MAADRASFALEAAREQQELFSEPLDKAKMLLSVSECLLACGLPAVSEALEAYAAFRDLDAPCLEGLALLSAAQAEPNRATEHLGRAVEAFQVDGEVNRGLGRALLGFGEWKAAGKALEVFKFCKDQRWQVGRWDGICVK